MASEEPRGTTRAPLTVPVVTARVAAARVAGTRAASRVPAARVTPPPAAAPVPRTSPTRRLADRRTAVVILLVSDLGTALVVLAAVAYGSPALRHHPGNQVAFVAITLAAMLLCLWAKRVYTRARRHIVPSPADDLGAVAAATLTSVLVVLAGRTVFTSLDTSLPTSSVLVGLGLCLVALPAARTLSLAVHKRTGTQAAKILVVGTGTIAADVGSRLTRAAHVELVGYVDDDPVDGQDVVGNLDDLPAICREQGIDRVVVAFSRAHPRRLAEVLRTLEGTVTIDVVPRYFELTGWEAVVDDLSGLALVSLGGSPPGPVGLAAKRALDVAGAALGLLVLAPLLAVVGLVVKLTSPGPVLFRQWRLGRNGAPFEILKFRTMRDATPEEIRERRRRSASDLLFDAAKDAQRVTVVGHALRRFGIDELPQLFNVLWGHMSMVGPRPFVPEECADLPGWANKRFEFRPGLTGMWQVCGQHDLRFDELCRLDCQYVDTWTFLADLRILARTPGRLLRGGTVDSAA